MTGRDRVIAFRSWYGGELPWLRRYAYFLLTAVSLGILVACALYFVQWPADGIEWSALTGTIAQVDASAPAAALVHPGDRVIKIDGVPLEQISQTYAGKRPGDQVVFKLLRAGQEQNLVIPLIAPSPLILLTRLEPLLIALLFLVIGFAVLALQPTDKTARLFYEFNQISCLGLIFGALSTIGLLWAGILFTVVLWFLGPVTLHLHTRFPKATALSHQRLLLASAYGLALVGSLLSIAANLDWLGLSTLEWFSRSAVRIYLLSSFLVAVVLLTLTYLHVTSPLVRQQVRLVVVGAALALIPFIGLALLPDALAGSPFIAYQVAFVFLVTIPLAYGYAILRHRLIRLERSISRTLAYLFVIILLIIFYLFLDAGLHSILPAALSESPWLHILLVLAVGLTFAPLRDRFQRAIDWAFYGGWYNYRSAVQKLSQAVAEVNDVDTLGNVLLYNLRTTLKLECACLLLQKRDGTFSAQRSCSLCPAQQRAPLHVRADGPLSQVLQNEQRPIQGDVLRQRLQGAPLNAEERQFVDCAQNRLWVPIGERPQLLGILILGPKPGDDFFDGEDLQILEVIRHQISVTVQNISLLLEVQQRAADMERLHQELLRGREAERKRLARELHDEIIQALVGLNYELAHLHSSETELANGRVTQLQSQVQQLMGHLRKICIELRPPALDSLGLVSAVRSRLRALEADETFRVKLTLDGNEEADLPEDVEICLYRVLQEALANIQKHAQATQVLVNLTIHSDEICLSIQDNGCGFQLPNQLGEFIDKGHFGLVGARERLDLVGGKLLLRSAPNEGTYLEARIPLLAPSPILS